MDGNGTMKYKCDYGSPLGKILLASDGEAITGLWFYGQKYFAAGLDPAAEEKALPVFETAKRWLDLYFGGEIPDFIPPLKFFGSDFQKSVWNELLKIPYGETVSYGDIAKKPGKSLGCPRAVGGAVGHNPVSIIVPCHRVLGKNGSLTGYAGGTDKKIKLLELENGHK